MRCPVCGKSFASTARFCGADGAALTEDHDVRPVEPLDARIGTLFDGRYRLVALLGTGGMSRAYLARHESGADGDVVVKVLHAGFARQSVGVARFLRETHILNQIDHPHVVRVFSSGLAPGGEYYLVIEHVRGETLAAAARGRALELGRVVHVLGGIARGLAGIHAAGVIHRDLKPDNVMLCHHRGDPAFVKLIDFGISRLERGDAPRITQAGEVLGTPEYMSPEQYGQGPVDFRSDLYAFGVLAYELCTGTLPFRGTIAQLMFQHLSEPPPDPRAVAPERAIPADLATILLACLAKRLEDRPTSAIAVLEAVLAIERALLDADDDESTKPTVYQGRSLDAVWDGPGLYREIERLHVVRRRRLYELASALWRGKLPAAVEAVTPSVASLEGRLEELGTELAVMHDDLEKCEARHRAAHGEVSARAFETNVRLARLRAVELGVAADEAPVEGAVDDVAARVRALDRDAGDITRQWQRDAGACHLGIARVVSEIADVERELASPLAVLARSIEVEAMRRPEAADLWKAYAAIDGAIATYRALLEALERPEEPAA